MPRIKSCIGARVAYVPRVFVVCFGRITRRRPSFAGKLAEVLFIVLEHSTRSLTLLGRGPFTACTNNGHPLTGLVPCSNCWHLVWQLNQQLEAWAEELGGDFELSIAGSTVVFVTGAEDMHRILLLRPSVFKRGWTPVRTFPLPRVHAWR